MLTACIGISSTVSEPLPEATPTATAQTKAAPIATNTAAPLDTPTAEPVAELVDWTTTASVDGDHYVLGNPNAPIRLIDFSDFL